MQRVTEAAEVEAGALTAGSLPAGEVKWSSELDNTEQSIVTD